MTPRNLHIGVYVNASSQLFRRRQNVVFGSVANELVNVLWLRIFHVDFQTVFMSIQLRISLINSVYLWTNRSFDVQLCRSTSYRSVLIIFQGELPEYIRINNLLYCIAELTAVSLRYTLAFRAYQNVNRDSVPPHYELLKWSCVSGTRQSSPEWSASSLQLLFPAQRTCHLAPKLHCHGFNFSI